MKAIADTIHGYHAAQTVAHKKVCEVLQKTIDNNLHNAESKIWHGAPVWFLNGNPIVGYSKQKPGIRLMFWSGADFDEPDLNVRGKKYKDASIFYNDAEEVDTGALKRWLEKATKIQWNYRDIVKNKGKLSLLP